MSVKISDILKEAIDSDKVAPTVGDFGRRYFLVQERSGTDRRKSDYKNFNNVYYDLVTDFFEYGWGRSFHFAPRAPNESFLASLARHEHFIALVLNLGPDMVAADLGCGVGGPLAEIARFSGARIVGVNNNAYQLERARQHTREAGLGHLASYLHCDFLHVSAADASFDAVYAIEATPCAPDKEGVYGEAFRLLKPGGSFAAYEYCLTDRYDEENPRHREIRTGIEVGGGLPEIVYPQEVEDALLKVGFEIIETRDLAVQTGPSIPWYEPLVGSGLSFASLRSTRGGRFVTHNSLRILEALRIVPRGTVQVSRMLSLGAAALAEAGRLGIFTPMYFLHARKPA